MPSANEAARDRRLRHDIGVRRNEQRVVRQTLQLLERTRDDLGKSLQGRLDRAARDGFDTGLVTTKRLRAMRDAVAARIAVARQQLQDQLHGEFIAMAESEIAFEREFLLDDLPAGVREHVRFISPDPVLVHQVVTRRPFAGAVLREHTKTWQRNSVQRIWGAIQVGLVEGETVDQLTRRVLSTRNPGSAFNLTKRGAELLVRTATTHVTSRARDLTWQANEDLVKRTMWLSTLDGKTCFVAGTMVETPTGSRPIEDIRPGDMVIGGSRQPRRVLGTTSAKRSDLVEVQLSNGAVVRCTSDHLFQLETGTWAEAATLRPGEGLATKMRGPPLATAIRAMTDAGDVAHAQTESTPENLRQLRGGVQRVAARSHQEWPSVVFKGGPVNLLGWVCTATLRWPRESIANFLRLLRSTVLSGCFLAHARRGGRRNVLCSGEEVLFGLVWSNGEEPPPALIRSGSPQLGRGEICASGTRRWLAGGAPCGLQEMGRALCRLWNWTGGLPSPVWAIAGHRSCGAVLEFHGCSEGQRNIEPPATVRVVSSESGGQAAGSATGVAASATVHDIEVEHDHSFIVGGVVAHNSAVCRARDGKTYPVGRGPRPPAHLACRSTTVPVLRSWRELGIDADELPASTRASMDGQVSSEINYDDWLKTQPEGFQKDVLGVKKWQLWKKGNLPLDKFVDRTGQELTLDQLRQRHAGPWRAAGLEEAA